MKYNFIFSCSRHRVISSMYYMQNIIKLSCLVQSSSTNFCSMLVVNQNMLCLFLFCYVFLFFFCQIISENINEQYPIRYRGQQLPTTLQMHVMMSIVKSCFRSRAQIWRLPWRSIYSFKIDFKRHGWANPTQLCNTSRSYLFCQYTVGLCIFLSQSMELTATRLDKAGLFCTDLHIWKLWRYST